MKCSLLRDSLVTMVAPRVSLSSMPKRPPASSGESMMTERQKASKVLTWTCFDLSLSLSTTSSGYVLRRASWSDSLSLMRSSISLAALFVNVSRSTSFGSTSFLAMRLTYLVTMVSVFPVPGPASTTMVPSSVSAMILWDSFGPSLIGIILLDGEDLAGAGLEVVAVTAVDPGLRRKVVGGSLHGLGVHPVDGFQEVVKHLPGDLH